MVIYLLDLREEHGHIFTGIEGGTLFMYRMRAPSPVLCWYQSQE